MTRRSHRAHPDGTSPGVGAVVRSLITAVVLAGLSHVGAADSFSTAAPEVERTPLVVLLLGGFRWDYLNYLDSNASGFSEFLNGASAKYVTSVFPSLSYPAWTTISTGLYPEDHGIIANVFLDRQMKAKFMLTNSTLTRKSFWWQTPEPIWTTARRNELNVATILWARSDIPVRGVKPEETQGYEQKYDTLAELQTTLIRTADYLGRDFDLVMAYNEHVDIVGHEYGPESNEMRFHINDIDKVLALFFAALKERKMYGKVNVVLISDHGMTAVPTCSPSHPSSCKSTTVDLQRILENREDIEEAFPQGPFVALYARPGRIENIMTNLRKVDGIVAYRRGEVPEYLHFNKHPRLPDIVICARIGLSIKGSHRFEGREMGPAGQHGYTPIERDMRTVFLATGPDFKTNFKVPPIQLIDEYQIFCHLLRIRAKPNNGSWERVRKLLRDEPAYPFGEEAPRAQPSTYSPAPVFSTTPPTSPRPLAPVQVVEATAREELAHVAEQPKAPSLKQPVAPTGAAISHTTSVLFTLIMALAGFYLNRYD